VVRAEYPGGGKVIEETARVAKVDGDAVEVVTERRTACGSCSAQKGCGTSLIAAWFPQRKLRFRVHNAIGARVGDQVVVGLDEAYLQRGALLLYAVPLIGMLVGAVAGESVGSALGMHPEPGAIGGGLLGLFGALGLVRRTRLESAGEHAVRLLRLAQPSISVTPGILVPGSGYGSRKQE
jgi:sigma-E factor negative regulatory protein RseC